MAVSSEPPSGSATRSTAVVAYRDDATVGNVFDGTKADAPAAQITPALNAVDTLMFEICCVIYQWRLL